MQKDEQQNEQQTEILLTIKLQQQLFVDPKRVKLLKAIQQTGSINQAAKNAEVSYKSAWDHLEMMNRISPKPLLARNTGGKNGGGTLLTAYALRLLQLYDLLAQTQAKAFEILQDESIALDSLLAATAKFAPQSSARNQFFGKIARLTVKNGQCEVAVEVANFPQKLTACITAASAERLALVVGKEVMLLVKAPWIGLHTTPPTEPNCFDAEVVQLGSAEVTLQSGDMHCYATRPQNIALQTGQKIWFTIDPQQIVLLSL